MTFGGCVVPDAVLRSFWISVIICARVVLLFVFVSSVRGCSMFRFHCSRHSLCSSWNRRDPLECMYSKMSYQIKTSQKVVERQFISLLATQRLNIESQRTITSHNSDRRMTAQLRKLTRPATAANQRYPATDRGGGYFAPPPFVFPPYLPK